MKVITFAQSFKRAYKSLIRKHPELQPKVEGVLTLLAENSFEPSLQTHKLKGQLAGSWPVLWSMTVGLYLILLRIQSREMRKFSCLILAAMMKFIERDRAW
ncbi:MULTISPECIES: type II toxin-antitoxin system YafQ family toxin [Kamptonema]|uniref:type II toxin-antitoxin system RelE/ParE family toxin n=1 Tax=Kamptonema TaxID=1501433 RepID=UPI0001DAC5B2|nr:MULTISPECIES: hypothetical protein [Kamptonema]CBN57343.1 hypothetical protein OSCI_3400046 [Kamptonema sp. PCC 6506]